MDLGLNAVFFANTNPDKFTLLWASNIHKKINKNMREVPLSFMKEKMPDMCYFLRGFLRNIFERGKTRDELLDMGLKNLYRGTDAMFFPSYEYRGFTSTSFDRKIAKKFVQESKGSIMKFKITDLPTTVPYLIIDENVAEYLHENEVLLLPGRFSVLNHFISNTENGLKQLQFLYEPDIGYINELKKMKKSSKRKSSETTHVGGYGAYFSDDYPHIELTKKVVVFWRMLKDGPVDIMRWYVLPNTDNAVIKYFRETLQHVEMYFENTLKYVPEYYELMQYVKEESNYEASPEEYQEKFTMLRQYDVQEAILDPSTGQVDTIHFGVYRKIYIECYGIEHEEKVKCALCAWWKDLKDRTHTKHMNDTQYRILV